MSMSTWPSTKQHQVDISRFQQWTVQMAKPRRWYICGKGGYGGGRKEERARLCPSRSRAWRLAEEEELIDFYWGTAPRGCPWGIRYRWPGESRFELLHLCREGGLATQEVNTAPGFLPPVLTRHFLYQAPLGTVNSQTAPDLWAVEFLARRFRGIRVEEVGHHDTCAQVHGTFVLEWFRSWSLPTAGWASATQGTQAAGTELSGGPGSPGQMEVNKGLKPGIVAFTDLFFPKVAVLDG